MTNQQCIYRPWSGTWVRRTMPACFTQRRSFSPRWTTKSTTGGAGLVTVPDADPVLPRRRIGCRLPATPCQCPGSYVNRDPLGVTCIEPLLLTLQTDGTGWHGAWKDHMNSSTNQGGSKPTRFVGGEATHPELLLGLLGKPHHRVQIHHYPELRFT